MSSRRQRRLSPREKTTASALASNVGEGHDKVLQDAGISSDEKVQDYVNALNGFSAAITYGEAVKVARRPEVAFVMPDELQQATTDSSPTFLGLTGDDGAWATGLTGEGVVVGVIDTGIWPEHPSFADEFNSARDDDGHGTHTASTAAGNSDVEASIFGQDYGKISGIAPRSHIVAYKGLGNLGGFTSDLAAAIDQAVLDGVDVINYSIGGGASLTGADELAFLFAADAGVYVATSAGNSGPGDGTVGGPGTAPWLTTVGASTQPRFFQGTVHLGNGKAYSGASITHGLDSAGLVDAAAAGNDLCVPGSLDPTAVDGKIVLCRRGTVDRAAKSLAVQEAGGVGMILYNNSNADNLFTDNHWVPSVHIDNTPGLKVKAYIATAGASATASFTTGEVSKWKSAPSITIFSSRARTSSLKTSSSQT